MITANITIGSNLFPGAQRCALCLKWGLAGALHWHSKAPISGLTWDKRKKI